MTIFVIIIVAIVMAVPLRVLWYSKKTKEEFINLINSDRYKKSKYEIQLIDNEYALKNKLSGNYVDLVRHSYEWPITHRYGEDCKGMKGNVISAFNYNNPNIKPINIEKTF